MQVGLWQIILIVLLFVLLFGSKRIPALMKDFVKGLKAVREEIEADTDKNKSKDNNPVVKKVKKKATHKKNSKK